LTLAAGLLGMTPLYASAQDVAKVLDGFKPGLRGVDYEMPKNPAAIKECKLDKLTDANNRQIGYVVRDGQGKLLRKFVDTDGKGGIDQWSYYLDAFEVYRELDLNGDKFLDECRWMNSGGTRVATVKSFQAEANRWTPRITGWKRISAEEAAKVLVQALVWRDLNLLETVMATPDELAALNLPKSAISQATTSAGRRRDEVIEVIKNLKGWDNQTTWSRLDAQMPHLIPADPGTNLKEDLVLMENALILPGAANSAANLQNLAFLQAPEMVKIGETWKFVELPRPVDANKPVLAVDGGIRAALFRDQTNVAVGQDPAVEAAMNDLAKFDQANANAKNKQELAKFHVGRIDKLREVIKASKTQDDRLAFNKQIVDSLAAAYQTGLYQPSADALDKLVAEGGKLSSYAEYRKIFADFALKNDQGGNVMNNQKKWMADLKAFLEKWPRSDEAPDALMQLASANEYNAEEDEAKKYYGMLASSFPESDQGKKAVGALKRLDLVGKTLELKGNGLDNQPVDASQYRGKTLVVTFWATWADTVKHDLPELVKLYEKYHAKGFEIIGVCVDEERGDVEQFLKTNSLPWAQIYEPGGLDKNPLAIAYGISSALPTMFLVDAQGKVVNRSIRTAAELDTQLEKMLAGKDGVAFGSK